MHTGIKVLATIVTIGLSMQFGVAAAMDDMKKDTMGKHATGANAVKKDAMAGDCAKDAMAASDGMKKDAMDHAAMGRDTMQKAPGKDCIDGGMRKDAMGADAMKGDAMKGDAMKGDAMKGDAMKK